MKQAIKPKNPIQKEAQLEVVSPRVRNYRALIVQGYVLFATIAFLSLAVLANFFPYFPFDLAISKTFQLLNNPYFAKLMQFASIPGYSPTQFIIIVLAILFLFVAGLRWESIATLVNGLGILILSNFFKLIVQRARPTPTLVNVFVKISDYSFPSGHVVTYTAFFGFLAFLSFTLLRKSYLRTFFLVLFLIPIILVGPSRIYLGAHWSSDALGGYLLGSLWLLASIYIYRWGKQRYFVKQPVAPKKI